jgi:hypothetical protein
MSGNLPPVHGPFAAEPNMLLARSSPNIKDAWLANNDVSPVLPVGPTKPEEISDGNSDMSRGGEERSSAADPQTTSTSSKDYLSTLEITAR